jgi:UDP-N-acetylglucosamine 1-carboxyvinyltransferase
MELFKINGPCKLKGEITPQGAKNEALQILAAVLMTTEKVVVKNIPEIVDIKRQMELLKLLGVKVKRISPNDYQFISDEVSLDAVVSDEFINLSKNIRGSVLLIAPLLARFKQMVLSRPGGDKIGRRKLDTHFLGFEKLGASFEFEPQTNLFKIKADNLKGTYIHLDEPSVTGTGMC